MNQFMFLKSLGFTVVEHTLITKNEIVIAVDFYKTKIESLPFLTDGLIVEFDDIAYGKAQGVTGHHSKSLYALKHSDGSYETIFRGVELNTTRTGIVSITGLFDEVDCDGAKVSRASLHNYDIFKALELGVSDVVTVYRANSVIPQIEENLTRSGTYKINMKCPSCGGNIVIRAPKVSNFLFCDNDDCPSKLVNKFVHYCSKNAMNIDGFSEAGIELFINEGFLKTFSDIYDLEQYKSRIVKLEGWGIKSYKKLIDAIEKSRIVKMENFLYALGINNVGLGGSKRLTQHFNNDIIRVMHASVTELLQVEDFGLTTANSVYNYFRNRNNIYEINKLLVFTEFKEEKKTEVSNMNTVFAGKKLYCTGSFESYKKEELKNIVEGLGGEFGSGYAKSLDYLVVGKLKGSSKEAKALKDGVPVLTEDEFLEMIGR